jgi:uncharacterized protein
MLQRLMPRSDRFFDDFEAQCSATLEGARLLAALFRDFTDIKAKVEQIKEVEHRGDQSTHLAFERLHKQFITPFDRADIHRLLSRIDDVLDLADAAAERVLYFEIDKVEPDARALADMLVLSCQKVQEVVRALRTIEKPDQILAGCREIKQIEHDADVLLRDALGRLFKSGQDPLTVIKWKEIYETIESSTDSCLDVANVIEGVVLEHS